MSADVNINDKLDEISWAEYQQVMSWPYIPRGWDWVVLMVEF